MVSIRDDAWEFRNPFVQLWELTTHEAGETMRHGMTEVTSVPKQISEATSDAGAFIVVGLLGLAYLWGKA